MTQNAKQNNIIKKLQLGINVNGGRILVDNQQFYSAEAARIITMYKIYDGFNHELLFKTASKLMCIFFLRDYLYILQGKELPNDNPKWVKMREKIDFTKEDNTDVSNA